MNNKAVKKISKSYEFMVLCVIVVLIIGLAAATKGKSIQLGNILDLMTNYSAYGVIAVGCLFVIFSGGIDISFMAVGAVAQYLSALYMIHRGGNFVMIYLIAIVTGTLLGFINAVLVNRLKAPTLIITIGTMNVIYGVMMKVTSGVRLHGFPEWFSKKVESSLFAVSVGTLAAVMVIAWFILKKTKMGRRVYAVGGNMEAAKRCGISVLQVHMFVYGFAGAMAAIGALINCYLSQQASIEALYGNEMDVLAMVVLGGVSLSGGKGSVSGTLLGIILVALLSNGMILVGVSSYWKDLVIGSVILISFCVTGWRMISAKRREG
ncbi:MAG: ABC transporter permease [[Clostridium] scindens]|uniref:ABC transporter permease n=1 Tax=Clostridium scindens (strain JCM 10418 / VPI 12708) TaxID=29347 RepID=UPI002B1F20D1|nr:ABC transporter permease [[Clostridium] scindens]MEA4820297.1 ABC transporter permease [[Clostridium] scindens]